MFTPCWSEVRILLLAPTRGNGGIGIHNRLKICRRDKPCGFEPRFPHQRKNIMKFYEVKQRAGGSSWYSLGFLRKKKDAEKYALLFNTKVLVRPVKIVEHEFKNLEDFEDDFNEAL
jgi:hypothetical protein